MDVSFHLDRVSSAHISILVGMTLNFSFLDIVYKIPIYHKMIWHFMCVCVCASILCPITSIRSVSKYGCWPYIIHCSLLFYWMTADNSYYITSYHHKTAFSFLFPLTPPPLPPHNRHVPSSTSWLAVRL